jgi:hypothetical protein
MMELSKLSPAQTYILIEGKDASQKDLLKYTFMDLLLKQVLATSKRNVKASKHDPLQVITYVSIGKNFRGYKPLAHELVFLQTFQKSKTLSIIFRHVVKMGYENSQGKKHYQNIITNTKEFEGCIKRDFLDRLLSGFSLTEKGITLKNKLKEELVYLDEHLPSIINYDKQKSLEILKQIKGNIFLLKNIDFEMLAEIDKKLIEEMNPRNDNSSNGCSGCVSTWDTYGHDWHSFDSSCSSCNSDSGGSGCSGCSGCGGCGGD